MTAIASVTPTDLSHVTVAFDAAIDAATIPATAWTVTPVVSSSAPCNVIDVVVDPSNLLAELLVGAGMSAGQSYVFAVTGALDATSAPIVPPDNQGTGVAPTIDAPSPEWPHAYLRAITQALGEEAQLLAGHPTTQLVRDLPWDATTAFVVSTLGFASSGAFFASGRRYIYTAKADMVLQGIVPDHTDGNDLPAGTEVHSDAAAVEPD
jgi:hypothetical protein